MNAPAPAPAPLPFVPADFVVPPMLETDEFRLRMLTVHDVVKDYDAVMSSADHCRTIWPGLGWPEGLTLTQNLMISVGTRRSSSCAGPSPTPW